MGCVMWKVYKAECYRHKGCSCTMRGAASVTLKVPSEQWLWSVNTLSVEVSGATAMDCLGYVRSSPVNSRASLSHRESEDY